MTQPVQQYTDKTNQNSEKFYTVFLILMTIFPEPSSSSIVHSRRLEFRQD